MVSRQHSPENRSSTDISDLRRARLMRSSPFGTLRSYFCGWGEEYEEPDSRGSGRCRRGSGCGAGLCGRSSGRAQAREARRARSARPALRRCAPLRPSQIRAGPARRSAARAASLRWRKVLPSPAPTSSRPLCGFPGLCSETPFSFTGNKTSATGGGFVGYRIQFGTMVVGIEGDAEREERIELLHLLGLATRSARDLHRVGQAGRRRLDPRPPRLPRHPVGAGLRHRRRCVRQRERIVRLQRP